MAKNVDRVRRDMRKLATVIAEVRKEYPRMELGQLHCLLLVLAKPGMSMNELVDPTGLTKSAVSRNIRALSEQSYLADDAGEARRGLDLLTLHADQFDARSKKAIPSTRGTRLAGRLADLLGETNGTQERETVAS